MHRWFNAIQLIAQWPRIPASELGRQLGLRQKTAWSMRQRIMRMMIQDAGLAQKIAEAAGAVQYKSAQRKS
jgi:hypothetical protein